MTARKVLVTGASGFLGIAVCRALTNAGSRVLAMWNRLPPALKHSRIEWVQADLSGSGPPPKLRRLAFDSVIHLAAVLPVAPITAEDAARVNRRIDDGAFRIAASRGATVIYASGTSVYGDLRDVTPVFEDMIPNPSNPYLRAKLAGEQLGADVVCAAGGRFVSLRVCAPYGPGQATQTVVQLFVERALTGEPLRYYGSGSREQAFTFVSDAAAAFLLALDAGNGCYNIAGGPPVSMKELAELIADLAGRPAGLVQAAGQPDPQEGVRARFNTGRAARELTWTPKVSLREGITRCLGARRSKLLP
jgi:nucleoside-diphosphate-sugar epimerase